jgi:hypothetical protein
MRCAVFTGSQKRLGTDTRLGLLTTVPRVRFRLISCEIRGRLCGCAAGVFRSTFFRFPLSSIIRTLLPYTGPRSTAQTTPASAFIQT